jgi:hypothetical protein
MDAFLGWQRLVGALILGALFIRWALGMALRWLAKRAEDVDSV